MASGEQWVFIYPEIRLGATSNIIVVPQAKGQVP